MTINRRAFLAAGAAALAGAAPARADADLLRRPIPSSGEKIPVVGLGSARRYNVEPAPEAVVKKTMDGAGFNATGPGPSTAAADSQCPFSSARPPPASRR